MMRSKGFAESVPGEKVRVVVDTNILVSALLTPQGAPARILDLVINQTLTLLVDDRILYEYREVFKRPKFGFKTELVDDLLSFLDTISEPINAQILPFKLPDPDDLPFLEVALSGKADVLITGNKKDFGRSPKGLKIVSASEFLSKTYSR